MRSTWFSLLLASLIYYCDGMLFKVLASCLGAPLPISSTGAQSNGMRIFPFSVTKDEFPHGKLLVYPQSHCPVHCCSSGVRSYLLVFTIVQSIEQVKFDPLSANNLRWNTPSHHTLKWIWPRGFDIKFLCKLSFTSGEIPFTVKNRKPQGMCYIISNKCCDGKVPIFHLSFVVN